MIDIIFCQIGITFRQSLTKNIWSSKNILAKSIKSRQLYTHFKDLKFMPVTLPEPKISNIIRPGHVTLRR
jgi:hypothetical protein